MILIIFDFYFIKKIKIYKEFTYINIYIEMSSLEDIQKIRASRSAIGAMFLILGGITGLFYIGSLLI